MSIFFVIVMLMNFLISNFNIIFLTAWCVFLVIVTVRYFQPNWLKNISYWRLITIAFLTHLLCGVVVLLKSSIMWSLFFEDPLNFFAILFFYSPVAFVIICCVLITVLALRFFQPLWVRNISYWWLITGAIFIHLLYGSLATILQYIVWGKTAFTKVFLVSPLAPEVPFPVLLEWTRPFFSGESGYFALYSFQHFFMSSLVLFFITALFVLFFRIYSAYRPLTISGEDIAVIALSFLIAGYTGAILLVPLAFIVAFILAIANASFKNLNQVSLATSFLIVSPFVFLFAIPILKYLNLYSIIKL